MDSDEAFLSGLLLLMVISVGLELSAQVQSVSPEHVLRAALDVKRVADAADKLDSDALEYCGSTHRAAITSSDVEESISEYLLKPGQLVPDTLPASNVWMVRNRISGVLHFVVLNALECATQADSRKGAREAAVRAMDIAANLGRARENLGALALQQTKWQEGEPLALAPDVGKGPIERVSSETILRASLEMESEAQIADNAEVDVASGRCDRWKGAHLTAANLHKDISEYLFVPGGHSPIYIPASNMWFVTRYVLTGEFHAATGAAICALDAERKKKAVKLGTKAYDAYKALKSARERFEELALQQTRWEEQQAIREQ
jgi:hypothetical protein